MSDAQAYTGFEQYMYVYKAAPLLVVPVIYYQSEQNWFIQSNMNYEQPKTFSVSAGKTFSEDDEFFWSVTPMIGLVSGSLNGAVMALNTEVRYKKILYTSQSHFVYSFKNTESDLLSSWMELGYQVIGQMFAGLSVQATVINATDMQMETGVFIRVNVKKWGFPVYCFNTASNNRYFTLGITREFSLPANKKIAVQ